jgi:hypothetical protein
VFRVFITLKPHMRRDEHGTKRNEKKPLKAAYSESGEHKTSHVGLTRNTNKICTASLMAWDFNDPSPFSVCHIRTTPRYLKLYSLARNGFLMQCNHESTERRGLSESRQTITSMRMKHTYKNLSR